MSLLWVSFSGCTRRFVTAGLVAFNVMCMLLVAVFCSFARSCNVDFDVYFPGY